MLSSVSSRYFFGANLGPGYRKAIEKQYERGIFHIMRGMECDRGAAEQIMHGLFQNLGQSLMEILYTPKLNKDNISQYVTLEHPERLDAALKENKGVIVLTGHIGNWEWMGASLALYGYPTTTIVKKQPNDQVTRLLNENREMMGLEVFARGGNEMIIAARALKRKKYWDFWPIRTADFTAFPSPFGEDVVDAAGTGAVRPQVPVAYSADFAIHDEHHRHRVVIGEVMYYEDTGNKDEDIARLTRKMAVLTEQFIKDHPTEWLWFQHRWSTAPEEIIALHQGAEADGSDDNTTQAE